MSSVSIDAFWFICLPVPNPSYHDWIKCVVADDLLHMPSERESNHCSSSRTLEDVTSSNEMSLPLSFIWQDVPLIFFSLTLPLPLLGTHSSTPSLGYSLFHSLSWVLKSIFVSWYHVTTTYFYPFSFLGIRPLNSFRTFGIRYSWTQSLLDDFFVDIFQNLWQQDAFFENFFDWKL